MCARRSDRASSGSVQPPEPLKAGRQAFAPPPSKLFSSAPRGQALLVSESMAEAAPGCRSSECTDLVPFSLSSPFTDHLRLPERTLSLRGCEFRIEQGWEADGRGGTTLGFGASVYPAAIVLADFLLQLGPRRLRRRNVLELGCGVGLSAIAAARAGAARVLATDGDAKAVELCKRNSARHLEGLHSDRGAPTWRVGKLEARQLLWGDHSATEEATAEMGGVDVVIGADIAACPYAAALEALARTISQLLGSTPISGPEAERSWASATAAVAGLLGSLEDASAPRPACAELMLLAYKRRGGETEQEFFRALERLGVRVAATATDEEIHPDFRVSDGASGLPGERVKLLVLTRARPVSGRPEATRDMERHSPSPA